MAFQDIEPEESAEFRNDSFVDVITGIGFVPKTIKEDIVDMVTFEFENGAPLDLFEPDDWGSLKDFSGIGRIIADLRKSGIKFQVDPEARKIRTVPSIIGAKVSFKCTKNEKTVRGEPKVYTNWNIDNIQMPDSDNSTKENEETGYDDEEIIETCKKNISTILRGHPCTMRDIIKNYSKLEHDRDARLKQLKVKEKVLDMMMEEGNVTIEGDEYILLE